MRASYHSELRGLAERLAVMSEAVGTALDQATRALLRADLALAERVIANDARIDQLRDGAEERACRLLALQAPVATDLRTVVTAIHAAGDLERMGDLALHVASAVGRRHPAHVLPDPVRPYFAEMGRVACGLATQTAAVIRAPNAADARRLDADDDALDDLHRHMFTLMMGPHWTYGVTCAVDVTLLARYYERFGDHAVAVARRMVYVITGRMPSALEV